MSRQPPTIHACGAHAVNALITAERAIAILSEERCDNPRIIKILQSARQQRIDVRIIPAVKLTELVGHNRHQGIAAVAKMPTCHLDDILQPPLETLVVLDGVDSPQNLGAILRTMRAFASRALILPKRGVAPLSPLAAKVASGAAAQIPIIRVPNIKRALQEIREAGYHVLGSDENGDEEIFTNLPPTPLCWVFGGEAKGLRRLTRENCDTLLRIPTIDGDGGCLNVAATCAVCLAQDSLRNTKKRHSGE